MEKVLFDNSFCRCLKMDEMSGVFQKPNGDILKCFSPMMLEVFDMVGIHIENKVLEAKPVVGAPEILIPKAASYDPNGKFCGYEMVAANGCDFNQSDQSLSIAERSDLHRYATIHSRIEKPVKAAKDIVFPDLCTCDNIFIDQNFNIQLIDYDGFQVGEEPVFLISTSLGNQEQYQNDKYMKNGSFTKELDKKSLISLYFLDTFNMNLEKVGCIDPSTNRPVTLDSFFQLLGLEDYDVMQKVWNTFQENRSNEYLGDDVFRIAEDYEMLTYQVPNHSDLFIKKLIKK